MKNFTVSGGCLCGSVRYTVTNPASCIVHCHCSRCRKGHAGLVTSCAIVNSDDLSIDRGEEDLTTYTFPPEVHRKFCRKCGCSLLYYMDKTPEKVLYYPATLDEDAHPGHPEGSEHHIYVASKAEWEVFETSLPWHEEDMSDEEYNRPRADWLATQE